MSQNSIEIIILSIITLVIIVAIGFVGKIKYDRSLELNFSRDVRNDKIIILKGWNKIELNKILQDFTKMYESRGFASDSITIQKQKSDKYELTFPSDIHPLLFVCLINYLAYPLHFNNSSVVAGEATITRDFDGLNQSLIGHKAIFYVPANDTEHSVVYMITENGEALELSLKSGYWSNIYESNLNLLAKELLSRTPGFNMAEFKNSIYESYLASKNYAGVPK